MHRTARTLAWTLIAMTTSLAPARAGADDGPVDYTLRFPAPQSHYVEVEARFPNPGAGQELVLMMPVWTPGSYLVREYARQVEGVSAADEAGKALAVKKVAKNRWSVEAAGAPTVVFRYRVYCREMGVQTNWVDGHFAILNGAPTFVSYADAKARTRAHAVALELPADWKESHTGLAATRGGPHHYIADDYDTLVDSPIYAGNPTVYRFEVDGKPHFLVNEGEGGVWDGARSAKDVEAIVKTQRDLWGQLPYEKYVFINLLVEAGGGLEHKNSTVLMTSRWATKTRSSYFGWLCLVSHEYFHTWNVKRMRPVELGPFDYENEVYTKSLWVAEGLTSYYDRLLVRRAGLCTDAEYLAGDPPGASGEPAKSEIAILHETPGRLVQPLEQASYDAWIKFYRRDENTPNTAISYYLKGAVVGFLLDAKIRESTGGKKSLDDLMRLGYERFSGETGFTPEQFRSLASEVAGQDLSDWFRTALETTDELEYESAMNWYGLRFAEAKPDASKPKKAWLGAETKNEGGRLMVAQVKRGTPAFDAGLNVGDEILAIGDHRARAEQWSKRMEQHRPGDSVELLISRRDLLHRLPVTFGEEPAPKYKVELIPDATAEQKEHLRAWLGAEAEAPTQAAGEPTK